MDGVFLWKTHFKVLRRTELEKSPCNGINYYNFRAGSGQHDFSVHAAKESNSATQRAGEEIEVVIPLCSKVNNLQQHRNHVAKRKVCRKD